MLWKCILCWSKALEFSFFYIVHWNGQWPCHTVTPYLCALVVHGKGTDATVCIKGQTSWVFINHLLNCVTACTMKSDSQYWPIWMIFLTRLNKLNLGLHGISTAIFNVQDKIKAIIRKLSLWSNCMNEKNRGLLVTAWFFG